MSILQSTIPSPAATANVSFFDTTYPDASTGDPCTERATSVPACKVRVCPYPLPSGRTTRPVAGLIVASVDQRKVRVPPASGWYMPRSLPGGLLRGGETVRFEAAGDPSGVPSFAGQVVAPVFVTLTAPKPHNTPKLTAGAAFDLAWSPSSPDGVVRVGLTAVQSTAQTTVTCDLDGKLGKGTIPADAMAQLAPGNLVFVVDSVSSTVVDAGAFAVTLEVSDSVVSGTAQLVAR